MNDYISREAAIRIASGYCHPANVPAELARLPAADVVPAQRWISTKERYPDKDGSYLVCDAGHISISWYAINLEEVDSYDFMGMRESGFYNYDSEYGYTTYPYPYWMELPKPPKENKNE